MADVMTFEEHRGPDQGSHRGLDRRRQQRAGVLGACGGAISFQPPRRPPPPQLAPNKPMRDWIKATGAPIVLGNDPDSAVARALIAWSPTTWVSMGDKDGENRHNLLKPYQVNGKLMSLGQTRCAVHALPAGPSRRRSHRRK